jgi:hypothetical protein
VRRVGGVRRVREVLLALAVTACTGVGTLIDTFATLDEARQAGAIERGWLPDALPRGTADIRVAHVSDGRYWGLFSFPPAQSDALHALVAAESTGAMPACDPPGRLEWWPRLLHSPVDPHAVQMTGLRVYTARDGRVTYAINWNQGRAYFWHQ